MPEGQVLKIPKDFPLELATLIGCTAQPPEPPETQVRVVTDNLHGNVIEDPYRWLEDQEAPETRAWIDSQNAYTQALLAYFPGKEKIRARFTELLKIDLVRSASW